MTTIPQSPGVYKIVCTPTGKVYIGSTIKLRRRWIKHATELRTNKHHSRKLQRAWNKYGEGAFVFNVLEVVNSPDELIQREQYYLDYYKAAHPNYGFNMLTQAYNGLGHSVSANARQRIGAVQRRRFSDPLERERWGNYLRETMTDTRRQQLIDNLQSPETRKKAFDARARTYRFTSPEGEVIIATGLRKFCRDHDLIFGSMSGVLTGRMKSHRGWKVERADV